MPTIIAENDESQWEDQTGILYHFPNRYTSALLPGTEVIYYKGRLKKAVYRDRRLSDDPHYFGRARIGEVYDDPKSDKGDKFALIEDYRLFAQAVPFRVDGETLEPIPANRSSNYFRDGVRVVSDETFARILGLATISGLSLADIRHDGRTNDVSQGLESAVEGKPHLRYVTQYERNRRLRTQAVGIHGFDCMGCGFNFERFYGEYGRDFIHVHHLKPVSEMEGGQEVNPETDLSVLCPNCHAIVHRYRGHTLTLEELRQMTSGLRDLFGTGK